MADFPKKLSAKLEKRKDENSVRSLSEHFEMVDFSSNDYLGLTKEGDISKGIQEILQKENVNFLGSTGSRLLTGNHRLYGQAENFLASYHRRDTALIFNSGYDANLGFFASVPQRNDIVFYDELCHASIRDGIQLGHAKGIKFKHNDNKDLNVKLRSFHERSGNEGTEVYLVTESVFSMDGDSPNLIGLSDLCQQNNVHLIVDEAHALGVFGRGLINELGLENKVFAQILTFGKALGCHGAAVLGSKDLKNYLINFSRSLIYTTALPPHSVASILAAYNVLDSSKGKRAIENVQDNIAYFRAKVLELNLNELFLPSNSAIQIVRMDSNDRVRNISRQLGKKGFDVRAIMSPTVPKGQERLRICIHSFNSREEMNVLLRTLKQCYIE